jgi:hypothetical protein
MVVVAAVWLVGFFVAYSDLLEAIPGRRAQRLIGWIVLGAFYVAFKYAPEDAGAVLIEAGQRAAKELSDLLFENLPGAPATPPTTTVLP